jgi:hypothetical protein
LSEGMTRAEQVPDTIYVTPDGQAFYTPDGVGRTWYDSDEEAMAEHGDDLTVIVLDVEPEDH